MLLQNGPKMRVIQEKYPHKSSSFFSMYRFDFMLHKDGSPYLMEVRRDCSAAAPGLTCFVFGLQECRALRLLRPLGACNRQRCDKHRHRLHLPFVHPGWHQWAIPDATVLLPLLLTCSRMERPS